MRIYRREGLQKVVREDKCYLGYTYYIDPGAKSGKTLN